MLNLHGTAVNSSEAGWPGMITHVSSINYYVEHVQEMIDFYQHKLGVPCPFAGYGGGDGAKFGFPERPSTVTIWSAERWSDYPAVVLNLLCEDIFATYDQLKHNGLELAPPERMVWGGYELRFQDPAGHTITVIEDSRA